MTAVVREARPEDVDAIATLAAVRRADYADAQPQFWNPADDAVERHRAFLASLVADDRVVTLVAHGGDRLLGYAVGSIVEPPPVYAPGGPSGYVDDFAVVDETLWPTVGRALLAEVGARLSAMGAVQLVVVSGRHDESKRESLRAAGLTIASEWYVAPLGPRAAD